MQIPNFEAPASKGVTEERENTKDVINNTRKGNKTPLSSSLSVSACLFCLRLSVCLWLICRSFSFYPPTLPRYLCQLVSFIFSSLFPSFLLSLCLCLSQSLSLTHSFTHSFLSPSLSLFSSSSPLFRLISPALILISFPLS